MSFLEIVVDEKRYGERTVLKNLRLTLARGEIVSLVGPSGCGKSTLLSIVAGLDKGARATVRLEGASDGEGIGFVFQEPRLFPWLDVARNIAFGSGDAPPSAAAVDALLAEVGLAGYGAHLPRQLSGGQAQRVAIACALYTRPRVLLLDEPFSAVDALTRIKLQDLLARVARERGLSVLLVTHDIDEAVHLSDRIVLLDRQPGPPRAETPVALARPRARGDAEAARLKAAILAMFDLETA
ncbi:ABC transporter ATP-binding protein [Herbaspirillum sp. SJZ107]|uniref:ABC transporter ATP-binding protein n=1 Tax=Herbaspirillum sp. SJZ107 TaxID=2572881 RepID=UPI001151BD38|nr:ABC transporter ATP-binding protein [Herbaspirillum sp. SJZ107]TQK11414.1 sulfonate transport system ATP-binding protein [Herbaspirillum sp. SJZ107]